MTTKTEALTMALHDIERYQTKRQDFDSFENTLIKIKEALAQSDRVLAVGKTISAEPSLPEQERNFCSRCGKRLGTEANVHTCCPPSVPTG